MELNSKFDNLFISEMLVNMVKFIILNINYNTLLLVKNSLKLISQMKIDIKSQISFYAREIDTGTEYSQREEAFRYSLSDSLLSTTIAGDRPIHQPTYTSRLEMPEPGITT